MSDVRRLTLEGQRVEDLPEEIRTGIAPSATVTVKLEPSASQPRYMKYHGAAAYMNTSIEEAVARVRALRDEWD